MRAPPIEGLKTVITITMRTQNTHGPGTHKSSERTWMTQKTRLPHQTPLVFRSVKRERERIQRRQTAAAAHCSHMLHTRPRTHKLGRNTHTRGQTRSRTHTRARACSEKNRAERGRQQRLRQWQAIDDCSLKNGCGSALRKAQRGAGRCGGQQRKSQKRSPLRLSWERVKVMLGRAM